MKCSNAKISSFLNDCLSYEETAKKSPIMSPTDAIPVMKHLPSQSGIESSYYLLELKGIWSEEFYTITYNIN